MWIKLWQVKLLRNLGSLPFDYLLISTMGDKLCAQSWIFDIFIVSVMNSMHWKVKDEA